MKIRATMNKTDPDMVELYTVLEGIKHEVLMCVCHVDCFSPDVCELLLDAESVDLSVEVFDESNAETR